MSHRIAVLPSLLLVSATAGLAQPAPSAPPSLPGCKNITLGAPPKYDGPYRTVQELCQKAPRGKPAPASLAPPTGPNAAAKDEAYSESLKEFFIHPESYRNLGWLSDAHWRLTGPYQGCPPDGSNYGVHPAVRISYSPEVIDWLCGGKKGDLPDNAVIVKEMASIDELVLDPLTQKLSVPQNTTPGSWTIMIKSKQGSRDGWYWGFFFDANGNPPIVTRSAAIPGVLPDHPTQPNPAWLPTGDPYGGGQGDVLYPYAGFGNYCTNCHASAAQESTFSALTNIIGQEITYKYLGDGKPLPALKLVAQSLHDRLAKSSPHDLKDLLAARLRQGAPSETAALKAQPAAVASSTPNPFPSALPQADRGFLATFPQLKDVPFEKVWASRFPGETFDHVSAAPGAAGPGQFITSDQCVGCHDATVNNASPPNMVFTQKDGTQLNLSPYAEWRASPMGLAGRDPIFFAQLESELNLASREPGLAGKGDCVQSLCLHCHGVMGQRQYAIDTGGVGPTGGLCPDFLPPEERKGKQTGQLFTRKTVNAWPEPGNDALAQPSAYGGLARDGISCLSCHHISSKDLAKPTTFTGNFEVTAANEVIGPYRDAVLTQPMQNGLNLTPEFGAQAKSAGLCASCHAINLPILDNDGSPAGFGFEQATYLEWLNSDFAKGKTAQTCQDCHMQAHLDGQPLAFEIANIEDASFPAVEGRLPDKDLALKSRSPYARHTLHGLNVFLNGYFQQFPLVLGVRQMDFMNAGPVPPLITARESALRIAQEETADLRIDSVAKANGALTAKVTVTNKAGHDLPSGVGFRRAFIEFLVLDGSGQPLWASGRTSAQGVILSGLTDQPLPSEFLQPDASGAQAYQPHHTKITGGGQVQIYEELVQDSDRRFTTSFLHLKHDVKDNRLRPKGWRRDGPFAKITRPEGTGDDPDFNGAVLSGEDTLTYEVTLPADQLAQASTVKATLYYQATPPYYLMQRFQSAAQGPETSDTERLYYLASHLDVGAKSQSGQPYMRDWKLQVASASRPLQ